ncbi:hypothetical protein F5884DRAFT_848861 [Xylogone sp. PMI_703]|nr:hypothetical protein F5884DRAFT_848861 [Xylogone sp. PMI_703]
MASAPAIRYVASTTKSALGSVFLQCHVKPGASKQREGISSVTDEVIEICVSARAQEGEANKAVKAVISETLQVPKSDVEIIRGVKSRDKTISVAGIAAEDKESSTIERIKKLLQNAID